MVTLNILGDLSGNGGNGGGERHVRWRGRYRPVDEHFCSRRIAACRRCHQHRSAQLTCTISLSPGEFITICNYHKSI